MPNITTLIGRTAITRFGERVEIIGAAHDPARVRVVPLGADRSVVEYFTPRLADLTLEEASR